LSPGQWTLTTTDGRVMTAEEIADVVAWLASKRTQYPGQPYARAE
jgi:hypothetical protein